MAIRMDGWRLRRLTRQPSGLDPEQQAVRQDLSNRAWNLAELDLAWTKQLSSLLSFFAVV